MKILTTALAIMAGTVVFGQWTGTGPVYTFDDVGINVTSPQAEFHVSGDMRLSSINNPTLLFYNTNAGSGTANGYVGLQGTTTTLKALTGNVSISSGNLVGNATTVAGHDAVNFGLTDVATPTANQFNWTNGLTNLMVLNGSGELGIGVTSPTSPMHIVCNNTGIQGGFRMVSSANAGQDWYYYIDANSDLAISDDGLDVITFQNSTRNVGIGTTNPLHRLHVGGDVAVSGQIVHPSDARLKENIQPIKNALTTIGQLNPSTYTHRANQTAEFELAKGKQYGLIAQEVEKVLPELVIQKTLIAKDGTIYKGINYEKLLPILVAAVKEQQQIIDELREENAETTLNHNKRLMEIEETLQVLQNTNEVKASK